MVALQYLAGHGGAVHLGRPVDQAHDDGGAPHAAQRHLVGDAEGTVDLYAAPDDVVQDLGGQDLDGRDVLADGPGIALLVDGPGHVEDEDYPAGRRRPRAVVQRDAHSEDRNADPGSERPEGL